MNSRGHSRCPFCAGTGRILAALGWGTVDFGPCLPCRGRGRLLVEFKPAAHASATPQASQCVGGHLSRYCGHKPGLQFPDGGRQPRASGEPGGKACRGNRRTTGTRGEDRSVPTGVPPVENQGRRPGQAGVGLRNFFRGVVEGLVHARSRLRTSVSNPTSPSISARGAGVTPSTGAAGAGVSS